MSNLPLQPPDTVVACRDDVIQFEIDGEIIALSVEQGTCLWDEPGVFAYLDFAGKSDAKIDDLCAALLGAYRVDPDVCEREVLNRSKNCAPKD